MSRRLLVAAASLGLLFATTATATQISASKRRASLPDLPAVEIAYVKTTLPNGLTLVVHEDHKAPVVAVNIWYHVGSKDEPPGRTGFAHLFEHLMFGRKTATTQGWFDQMSAVGATGLNGTTNEDRTNFFETVPTSGLDRTLYLEARRMGHLLDDFTDDTLTTQRGVVQNEKRQRENAPYAVSDALITKSVWPAAHPYSHTVIGEMADLDAAKIADVKDWYARFYGPNNAVIAISGDITSEEAQAKVARYFGTIPPGPPVVRQREWIAARTAPQRASAQDHVAQARLYKVWNTPGDATADDDYLNLLSDILITGKDSRLYRRLVVQDQIATDVGGGVDDREIGSLFQIELTAKPGVPLDRLERAFDEELARLLRDGPKSAEVERYRAYEVSTVIRSAERVGGFGGSSDILAKSYTFTGSPDAWKVALARVRAATPADVVAAGRRWLSAGDLTLELTPYPDFKAAGAGPTSPPALGAVKPPVFSRLRRATLSNGLKVVVAERHDTPTVVFDMVLDAGTASDQFAKPGTAQLTAALLADGTAQMDALQLSDQLMRLGATTSVSTGGDVTTLGLSALTTRLDPALDLYADVIRHPAFRAGDVAREKSLRIAEIQQAQQDPQAEAQRIAPALVYGPRHAYGVLATEASVAALTPEDLRRYHATWFQPVGATLVVVGDTTLETILPKLQARFGDWSPMTIPVKAVGPVTDPGPSASSTSIYLVDKPDALQSVIIAASAAPPRVNSDDVAIRAMNTAFGGTFSARLNMNLREDKHWSYGAFSDVDDARGPSLFSAFAPVQTDKTAESFAEMRRELNDMVSKRPLDARDLKLAQDRLTLTLPGRWETNQRIATDMAEIATYGLPDAYYDTYASRIGQLSTADLARAAKTVVRPASFTWVIVGDRKVIEPRLKAQGLAIRPIDADGKPVS